MSILIVQPSEAEQRDVERDPDSVYTPGWCTRGLLDLEPPPTEVVCEPCAGNGAIVRELVNAGYCVWAVERRESCAEELHSCGSPHILHVLIADAGVTAWPLPGHSVVTNCPYSNALDWVRRAVEAGGYAAFLLRAGFWDADYRAKWLEEHPPSDMLGLSPRPFGSAWAHCWWVWGGSGRGWRQIRRRRYET